MMEQADSGVGTKRLRWRDRSLTVAPGRPVLMGIVNASPESFSDGGEVSTLDAQVERALAFVADGAEIIDVGGESGVTGVHPLSVADEASRVLPLVERLVRAGVIVSVDTWKYGVAQAVLDAGAHAINDVSGLLEPRLADACAAHDAGLIVMHTRARPKVKEFPRYADVMADVLGFLRGRAQMALDRGVRPDALVVDPGPDFAKTPAETVRILRRLPEVAALGYPVLVAVARKDFVGALTLRTPRQRLAGTLAAIGECVDQAAAVVRVHDVREVRDFLLVRAALRGEHAVPDDLHLPVALRREPPGPG